MSYEVQLEALGHDAKIWDTTSDALSTASTSASGITVTTNTSSMIADATGFNGAYADLQTFVAALLAEGSTTTGAMASTLRDVRKQYEADDVAAMTRIGAEWAPVE